MVKGLAFLAVRLRLFALIAVAALLFSPEGADARTITDSAGRIVDVPDRIARVYASGPPAAIMLYVLAPEKLAGWPRALRDAERPYIAEAYRDLPATGRLTGRGDTANLEVVIGANPDLIVDFGSVNETYSSLADRVQAQTGIPYVLINGRFENTPEALRLMGEILGIEERAEKLAAYVEMLFGDIDAALADIPLDKRPRVYLARGPDGLETGLRGSINTEIIERAGGRNVADPGLDSPVRRGLVRASPEQVIIANPDTIVTWDPTFFESVWETPIWQGIDAVENGRVYLAPSLPFGWIDRPPSLNRIMGLRWLSAVFFPDRFPLDLEAATREFYSLFYHVDLPDEDLNRLTAAAKGGRPE